MTTATLEARLGTAWKKPPLITNPALRWGLFIGAAIYIVLAVASIDVNWSRVAEGLSRGWAFIASFFNPDFTSRGSDIWDGILESIIITITSTVVGILISIPIGLGAARNIAPLPVYLVCRAIVALSRALNEIIVAILLVPDRPVDVPSRHQFPRIRGVGTGRRRRYRGDTQHRLRPL